VMREACDDLRLVERMALAAIGHAVGHIGHLVFHLFGIAVLSVRESLQAKLRLFLGKLDERTLRIDRRGVADLAHAALPVGEISLMTFDAGRMTRKDRRRIVVFALMAEGAIFGLRLVLFACVIEGRDLFNHLRVDDIEGRLAHRLNRSRSIGVIDRRVQILFAAAARPQADEQRKDGNRDDLLEQFCGVVFHSRVAQSV